jgi:hypothetical protein
MLAGADRLPDDDEEINLTREGWDVDGLVEGLAAAAQYHEQVEREQRDLRDWARHTLEQGDVRCQCRAGWRCLRCRVHAIVYPVSAVRKFEMGEVPF